MTCDEYDALRARSEGRCEICGTPEAETGGKRLVVDHYQRHGLHFVRGMICDSCNVVMSCMDGNKNWGKNRRWEAKAKEYVANSWQKPTPELELTNRQPTRPAPAPRRTRVEQISLPGSGPAAMARILRRHLSRGQIERLIDHLSKP